MEQVSMERRVSEDGRPCVGLEIRIYLASLCRISRLMRAPQMGVLESLVTVNSNECLYTLIPLKVMEKGTDNQVFI